MFTFGVSLHVGTLLGEPETDAQSVLQKEFGSPKNLLDYLKREGVSSIEVRNVREYMPVERSVAAIQVAHGAGFQVSVHIAFEQRTGAEYVNRVRPVIDEALKDQQSVVFTLHPLKDDEETARCYADWAAAIGGVDERCRLALENMRTLKPGKEHHRLGRVAKNILLAPEAPRGICWDMGHYAYNVVTSGLRAESCPCEAIIDQMIHTHIHSMYVPDLDTHFPLMTENEPVSAYVKALRDRHYAGIYNLELEPERFIRVMSPRAGFEQSVSVLKELMA